MIMRALVVALLSFSWQVYGVFPVIKSLDGEKVIHVHAHVKDNARARQARWGGEQAPLLPTTHAIPGPPHGNSVGKLPALGFNSWNAYRCDINEARFLDAAHLMISLGLKDAGYEYVNIDDCWSWGERDPLTHRLRHDPFRFPEGINGTAKKIHELGLKIGIYSSAGTHTCAGYPASLGYEDIDAQTWADWGIDYLKYDNCNIPAEWEDECEYCVVDLDNHAGFTPGPNGTCPEEAAEWCPKDYDYRKSKTFERFRRMQVAIQKTGRGMLFSLCQWGSANVQQWGGEVGQSWRSTGDIFPNWPRIKEILNENSFYLANLGFYAHSDPDMLEVGNLPDSPTRDAETRSHFALWAAMKSPLLIGTDLAALSSHDLSVLKNSFLLAFNQDAHFPKPAEPWKWGTNPDWTFDMERPAEYWAGRFTLGVLVLVLNTDDSKAGRVVYFQQVPGLDGRKRYLLTNVWTGEELGCHARGFVTVVGAHDTAAVVVGDEC